MIGILVRQWCLIGWWERKSAKQVKDPQDTPAATLELRASTLTMAADIVALVKKDTWETPTSAKAAKVNNQLFSFIVKLNQLLIVVIVTTIYRVILKYS